ncbi:MAG: DNA translocase FtsK [Barnesiella sp.]|nr:DNA translocase FtsK [Barnesiella sp.]
MTNRYSEIDDSSFDAEELLNPRQPRQAVAEESHVPPPPTQRPEPAAPSVRPDNTRELHQQPQQHVTPAEDMRAQRAEETPPHTTPASNPGEVFSAQSRPAAQERDAAAAPPRKVREELIGESTVQKVRMFSGIVLFFLAAYSLIVTISYIANLAHDQSALLGADYDPYLYGNAGGMVGAWMSHFLLYEWLGVGSFIFIYYLGALSLKLLNVLDFKFWSFTFKCLLSAIAVSIIGGFVVEAFNLHSRFYWGGLHGYTINHQLTLLSGIWGALAISCIMAGLLVVMFIDSLSKFGRFINVQIEKLRERRRREQAEFNARRQEAERIRAEEKEAARLEMEERIRQEEAEEARRMAEAQAAAHAQAEAQAVQEAKAAAQARAAESVASERINEPDREIEKVAAEVVDTPVAPVERHYDSPNPEPAAPVEDVLFVKPAPVSAISEIPSVADDEPLFAGETSVMEADDSEAADSAEYDNSLFGGEEVESLSADCEYPSDEHEADTAEDMNEHEEQEKSQPLFETVGDMVVEKPVIEQCEQMSQPTGYDPTAELSHYTFPSLELLRDVAYSTDSVDATEMEENKVRITKTLGDYGIPIQHIHATVGPTVTLYEIIPAEGVRIAKIKRLEDDIAMSLAALGIRIIAPIPGKGTIGIEVPNKDPQVVSIRSILSSRKFQESNMELPMALGCTISNEVFMADLAKMPHLLVAGATGMGKSVGLNTIIASLLYKKHPTELKFVLIDPKMVEFSLYASLERHYLAKLPDEEDAIITDPNKVVATLNSLCIEMDNRYALLKMASCRNIKEYNERIRHGNLMAKHSEGHRFLPYIVVIVDEFADLIMTAGKEVETPIARIAQKARAVGIHMILATQRPSTNVITGVIKANFPGRIAFRVFQMVDSRTILDRPGANQLIGRGDMLFSNNGKIERVQCAFIDTPEVEAICDAISHQVGMEIYPLPEYVPETEGVGGLGGNPSDRDPLFGDAARYVVQTDTASTSSLQRRYSIGYNRAGKIMDQLEAAGIVGPSQGGKPRQVLMDTMQVARMLGDE